MPDDEQDLRTPAVAVPGPGEFLNGIHDSLMVTLMTSDVPLLGLAAPQIGISYQVIVVVNAPAFYLVNPTIIWRSNRTSVEREGCASIPGRTIRVERPTSVRVTWWDIHWEEHEHRFDGKLARVVQHEIDHLFGVLITDKPYRRRV